MNVLLCGFGDFEPAPIAQLIRQPVCAPVLPANMFPSRCAVSELAGKAWSKKYPLLFCCAQFVSGPVQNERYHNTLWVLGLMAAAVSRGSEQAGQFDGGFSQGGSGGAQYRCPNRGRTELPTRTNNTVTISHYTPHTQRTCSYANLCALQGGTLSLVPVLQHQLNQCIHPPPLDPMQTRQQHAPAFPAQPRCSSSPGF
jgi:hypothetical protein